MTAAEIALLAALIKLKLAQQENEKPTPSDEIINGLTFKPQGIVTDGVFQWGLTTTQTTANGWHIHAVASTEMAGSMLYFMAESGNDMRDVFIPYIDKDMRFAAARVKVFLEEKFSKECPRDIYPKPAPAIKPIVIAKNNTTISVVLPKQPGLFARLWAWLKEPLK